MDKRFWCPACENYINGDFGPICGAHLCEPCKSKGYDFKSCDQPKKTRSKKNQP